MLNGLRSRIFQWRLQKKASQVQYQHSFRSFTALHSIQVLAPVETEMEGRGWKKWIQQWRDRGVKVSAFYYITHKQPEFYPDDPYITRKDLSLFYIPQQAALYEWLSQPADMLVIPARTLAKPLAWAAAHSAAAMRVGPHDPAYQEFFELMVQFPEQDPEQPLILATFDRYLQMLK